MLYYSFPNELNILFADKTSQHFSITNLKLKAFSITPQCMKLTINSQLRLFFPPMFCNKPKEVLYISDFLKYLPNIYVGAKADLIK